MLIDDLISKGTEEPYRMFTSRAEYRTLLRQDNADLRLTEIGFNLGLASQQRMDLLNQKKDQLQKTISVLQDFSIEPAEINSFLESRLSAPLTQKQKAAQLLLRPSLSLSDMMEALPSLRLQLEGHSREALEQAEIQLKYEVYIGKEKELVKRMSQMEELPIPGNFNYKNIQSISNEAREKLTRIKPQTLGQASRISGINPSDVQILMVYMGR